MVSAKQHSITHAKNASPIFGKGKDLGDNVLPTSADVMEYYILIQNSYEAKRGSQHLSVLDVSENSYTPS